MKTFLFVGLLCCSCLASAQSDAGWHDRAGHAIPDTSARKASNGFGGWVLVTSDPDWQEKWNTPASATPNFTEAKKVALGKKAYVLMFFANPELTTGREADVSCDFDVIRPDGSKSTDQKGAECFKGTVNVDPRGTFLSEPVIGFSGDPGDPLGEWVVHVTLHDNVRHSSVSLQTSFTLVEK